MLAVNKQSQRAVVSHRSLDLCDWGFSNHFLFCYKGRINLNQVVTLSKSFQLPLATCEVSCKSFGHCCSIIALLPAVR